MVMTAKALAYSGEDDKGTMIGESLFMIQRPYANLVFLIGRVFEAWSLINSKALDLFWTCSSADYQPDGLSSPLMGSNGRRSPANNSGSNSPCGRDPVTVEVNGENKDEVSALPEAFQSRLDKPRRR